MDVNQYYSGDHFIMCRTIIESCHIPEINYMLIIPQFKKDEYTQTDGTFK